jgi:CheY-like chemotaxis protein
MKTNPIETTIMIVDDEPENLNVLGEMLRAAKLSVRALPGGVQALAAAQDELPYLILLDIQMPGMDGYETCRRFKADEHLSQIPILFLSAFSEPIDKLRAFESGGLDYITKPFSEAEVLARIHVHLELRRHQLHLEELVLKRVRELAEARRRLQIWDDAKNQWLSVLSHEMRTPLNGILGISELLFADLPADSSHHELRPEYDFSCKRLEKLMNDAVTLANVNVAAEHFPREPVRLMQLLEGALVEVMKQAPESVVHSAIGGVEPVIVRGDMALLTRAFVDLLVTATHCVATGEIIALSARIMTSEAKVTIITQGASLTPEALETFFEVGGQRTLLKGAGDFGLGAALAGHIVRLFGGRVRIHNGPIQGLVIQIFLPMEVSHSITDSAD